MVITIITDSCYTTVQALGISPADIIFQMICHCRTATVTLIKPSAILTGMDSQLSERVKNRVTVPDLLKGTAPYRPGKKIFVAAEMHRGIRCRLVRHSR